MDGKILSRLNNLDSEFVAVHGASKASVSRNEGGVIRPSVTIRGDEWVQLRYKIFGGSLTFYIKKAVGAYGHGFLTK